jgi:hypothetical protein
LPLSTRVHELAKELGLKSQELLDRIQKWGLDVKVSALASLDPSTVGAGAGGAGRDGGALGAAVRSATAAVGAAGADELAPGRWAVEAVGLIGGVSEGLGRGGVGDVDSFAAPAA